MHEKYKCYCGLYCGNCAVKANIEPAAKKLHDEIKNAHFEDVMPLIPNGDKFMEFLVFLVNGLCISCKDGSGNPGCEVRKCAEKKGVDMCALCDSYPCDLMAQFLKDYPTLKTDNELLRDKGMAAWAALQDERRASGFTYSDYKKWGY